MQMEDMRDINFVIFVIGGIGVCSTVFAVNVHRMNFILEHSIVK